MAALEGVDHLLHLCCWWWCVMLWWRWSPVREEGRGAVSFSEPQWASVRASVRGMGLSWRWLHWYPCTNDCWQGVLTPHGVGCHSVMRFWCLSPKKRWQTMLWRHKAWLYLLSCQQLAQWVQLSYVLSQHRLASFWRQIPKSHET